MGDPRLDAVTMIGDSLSADIAGADAFGLATVWVAPPGSESPEENDPVPTHRIAERRESPALLV